jgi:hypothetical protein
LPPHRPIRRVAPVQTPESRGGQPCCGTHALRATR